MDLALFDFDGTISCADTFTPFLHFAVPRWRIAAGSVALSPLIAGYELGLVSAPTMRAYLVAAGFRGRLKAEVQSAGERYGNDVIPGVLRSEAIAKIRWHKARGDRVVVVSATRSSSPTGTPRKTERCWRSRTRSTIAGARCSRPCPWPLTV